MPKARPQAPAAEVKVNYVDSKLAIEQEWDKKEPEFKHVWRDLSTELKDSEWVKDASGIISNKILGLARIPREQWDARKKMQSDSTLDLMKTVRTNEDGSAFVSDALTQYRNPKRVRNEE